MAEGEPAPRLTVPHGDPVAAELTTVIHGGDLDALRRLLAERPELASVRMIGRHGLEGGWRTPLHVAADWPGYFPAAPAAVAMLLEAGADPNDDTGGGRPETPLHWAASSDDVDVAVALIEGGAHIETPGGSIGTPLDNAIGYACWHVARLLVARGAKVEKLWHAAALGMVQRLEQLLGQRPAAAGEVSTAFWHACAGGQRRAAEYLLAQGADLNWVPDYANGTPLDAASSRGTQRENVVGWLRERGATSVEPGPAAVSASASRSSAAVVRAYYDAWRAGDFGRLRSLLADEMEFSGPLAEIKGADECVEGLKRMSAILTDIEVELMISDGADVLTWFELHTRVAAPIPVASWGHVEDAKITRLRVAFDPRPILPPD